MQIQVSREACCAQDDQLGPLEMVYNLSSDATLSELVQKIVASRFLQYSSSHTTMLGEAGTVGVVKVFSAYYCGNKEAEFLAAPDEPVRSVIAANVLHFRFVFA